MSLMQRRMMMAMGMEEDEVKEWKMIADYTVEEAAASLMFDTDADGKPFEIDELIIIADVKSFINGKYLRISANAINKGIAYAFLAGDFMFKAHIASVCGQLMHISGIRGSNVYNIATAFETYGAARGVDIGGKIKTIYISLSTGESGGITEGSRYTIYGR